MRRITRTVSSTRAVALALIAAVAIGLAYLWLASAPGMLSVPAGSEPGDMTLVPCTYPTAGGVYEADCGTLVVAENSADPDSRLIARR